MKFKILVLSSVIIFFACSAQASAAPRGTPEGLSAPEEGKTTPPEVSLAEFVQTLEQSPEIAAARAEWLAAKKRVWTESALPDPVGGYDIMGGMVETRVGPQKNRFTISQEIPFPWKLYKKGQAAHEEAKAAYFKYEGTRRDVLNRVEKAYDDLYFTQAASRVVDEVKELLKKFEAAAQSRYSNLSGSQRDVAKTQVEFSMNLEKQIMLDHDREAFKAVINALLDRDPFADIGNVRPPEKPVLKYSLVELVNLAVKNRAQIQEMEAMAKNAGHLKRLAQLAYIPDINVGFEYVRVGSGSTNEAPDMDGKDSWSFPMRITLPVWQNRLIPAVMEAGQKKKAGEARVLQARNQTFLEVKEAYHAYDSARRIAELYETAVIPQAELALRSDQAGYESGKADFLEFLDSERVYLNAKLNYLQAFTRSLKSYSDLVRAAGLDLEGLREKEEGGRS